MFLERNVQTVDLGVLFAHQNLVHRSEKNVRAESGDINRWNLPSPQSQYHLTRYVIHSRSINILADLLASHRAPFFEHEISYGKCHSFKQSIPAACGWVALFRKSWLLSNRWDQASQDQQRLAYRPFHWLDLSRCEQSVDDVIPNR